MASTRDSNELAYMGHIKGLDKIYNMKANKNLLYKNYEVSFLDLLSF